MTDASAAFFAELETRGHEPSLEKSTGTVRFDLRNGKRITRWLVTIEKGDLAVTRRNAKADCVVRTDKTLFDGIVSGTENAVAAVLRGEMGIEGDRELIVRFQRLFPSPPRKGS
jgi:putative sterol carrier protein